MCGLFAAIIRESLRLGPAIPWRQVYANEDTTIGGGKYFIPKDQRIIIHTEQVHRDCSVWGDDVRNKVVSIFGC